MHRVKCPKTIFYYTTLYYILLFYDSLWKLAPSKKNAVMKFWGTLAIFVTTAWFWHLILSGTSTSKVEGWMNFTINIYPTNQTQTSPWSGRSVSGVEEPRHPDEKWATGPRRHQWAKDENKSLLECYYSSNPSRRGYMIRMRDLRNLWYPTSTLTEKQLVAQSSKIWKNELLSQHTCYSHGEPGQQVRGEISSIPPKIEYQAPSAIENRSEITVSMFVFV